MKGKKLVESLAKITTFSGSFIEISTEYRNKLERFKDDNSKFIVMTFDDVKKILERRIKDDYFVCSRECGFKNGEIREVICFDRELSERVMVEIFDIEHFPSGDFGLKMVLVCPPDIPSK
jgi:adenylate kinase